MNIGQEAHQYPSLAILYVFYLLLAVAAVGDDDPRMGSLAGRNCRIEPGPLEGKGEIGRCWAVALSWLAEGTS